MGLQHSYAVVVPVYNGGAIWKQAAAALAQAVQADPRFHVLVVDSSSTDDSAQVARQAGFAVHTVSTADFDHGGTRNLAVEMLVDAQVVVFLTQDAILCDAGALRSLVQAFSNPLLAVAYGRQLPHVDANPIAAHARRFNYGPQPYVAGIESRSAFGLKTVFTSNSFAAYRRSVFQQLGGFPQKVILSEDMFFAARAVQAGYKVAYVPVACVRHSHNYSPLEEFRRYFDIGVFQADQGWIGQEFGGAGGEGKRFLISELCYLLRHAPLWLPRAWLHDALKICGYKLGKWHKALPAGLCSRLGMNRRYWRA